jgi:hypothetical protein
MAPEGLPIIEEWWKCSRAWSSALPENHTDIRFIHQERAGKTLGIHTLFRIPKYSTFLFFADRFNATPMFAAYHAERVYNMLQNR